MNQYDLRCSCQHVFVISLMSRFFGAVYAVIWIWTYSAECRRDHRKYKYALNALLCWLLPPLSVYNSSCGFMYFLASVQWIKYRRILFGKETSWWIINDVQVTHISMWYCSYVENWGRMRFGVIGEPLTQEFTNDLGIIINYTFMFQVANTVVFTPLW
uniref:Uncharacterized protein n=1 Tax=Trichobilharzia regenti TaxID=157069 RepID=A0AA85JCP9_TRIRE|nr:unnamed protein product [Trichobilharzia regenti]